MNTLHRITRYATILALAALALLAALTSLPLATAMATPVASHRQGPVLRLSVPNSPLHLGTVRFEAVVEHSPTADFSIAQVKFLLDGEVVVQRRTEPYTASIFLGRLPEQHVVAAIALDAEDRELARAERVLNRQRNVFEARFIKPSATDAEPASSTKSPVAVGAVEVEIDVNLPPETELDHVDLFLNETKTETFTQAPFIATVQLQEPKRTNYLRTVAHLSDGNTTEAIVFVDSSVRTENLDVQYVQLYLSVRERRSSQPILDLEASDFAIQEDQRPQQIRRFERVSDLPLNLAVLLDVSASMAPRMEQSAAAARTFFASTMRPKDRATLITFNDRPTLQVDLTADTDELSQALLGTKALKGTALYDSLVFALYQLKGIKGQRAALVLSDGSDETSTLRYSDALEYVRRAGVPLYAVRIEQDRGQKRARAELQELTAASGGRAFFIKDASELEAAYRSIAEELRSRYLATYQSNQQTTNRRYREIEVKVGRKGVTVSTLSGYYP